MRARAPGKVVLSGAYSVLEGAPAIVSAVDRYVLADASLSADFVTPEVRAALGEGRAPYVDASALRAEDRKLGLGSSAAILVASLAACDPESTLTAAVLGALERRARNAHQAAQGGGSGIDVAASVWGGTLLCQRESDGALALRAVELPAGMTIEVWASGTAASTPALLTSVRRLAAEQPGIHRRIMAALHAAAEQASTAIASASAQDFIAALAAQGEGLAELGDAAGVPIMTQELKALAASASAEGAAFLPSGAGGGDISLWVAVAPASATFNRLATGLGQHRLQLSLHARGVHRVD
jgi:phosphomevalonate kinase